MRPSICIDCGGAGRDESTSRQLPCVPCGGAGVVQVDGPDPWARYREHYNIPVTPSRLALEESLSDAFD